MLSSIVRYLRPPAVRDRIQLEAFMSGEASYLAQRATYEFSRNTLAWFGQSAFADPAFNAQFRFCRWECFAAVLQGFATIGACRLRMAWRAGPDALAHAMTASVARMLRAYEVPAHRRSWDEVEARLLDQLAQPHLPALAWLAEHAAERAYATAPARSANEAEDRRVILNAMKFGMIAFQDRWDTRVDCDAIAAALAPTP